jgi:diguanylate cyclase (GGDEF)-like protein|nr:EAL domain-containing protein [Vallitaleaceae bacterium]
MVPYKDEDEVLKALDLEEIDGYIAQANVFVDDTLLLESFQISGEKVVVYGEDRLLISIIDKTISYLRGNYQYTDIFNYISMNNSKQIFTQMLTQQESAWLEQNQTINVGIGEALPMVFKKNDTLYGPTIGYLNQFSRYVGINFSYITGDYETLVSQAETYGIQIINCTNNVLPEGYYKSNSFLTSPYIVVGQRSKPMPNSELEISQDTIGMLFGDDINFYFLSNMPSANYKYYEDYDQLIEAVSKMTVDYAIMPEHVLSYSVYVKDNKEISEKYKLNQSSTYEFITNDEILRSILNKYEMLYYDDDYVIDSFTSVPSELDSGINWPVVISIIALILPVVIGTTYYKYQKNKDETKQLTYMFLHDQLTNIPNSYGLEQKYNQLSSDATLNGALIVIDIDNFNLINDQFGNKKGDEILLGFVRVLMHLIDEHTVIGRTGGDEFTIIASHLFKEEIDELIIAIQEIVTEYSHSIIYINQMTVSIGVVYFPEYGQEYSELDMYAEHAVRQRKKEGNNGVTMFTMDMFDNYVNNQALLQEIKHAIDSENIILYAQPQLNGDGSKVKGCEILIRWHHETKGVLYPDVFLPVAEGNGLMNLIDFYVLEKTCHEIKKWEGMYDDMKVSVNMAGSTFTDPHMLIKLEEHIKVIGFNPSWLTIEITEKMGINDLSKAQHIFQQLSDLGVSIALDDFGKGYSSISYLQNLKFDVLKIDKTFIDNIHTDYKDYQVYEIITHLARVLELTIVAEGVELLEQVNILKEVPDIIIQGYYYSKPLTILDFEGFCNLKK